MADEITLRLDRATAEDLYVTLHEVGEHIAAGAPITPPTTEEVSSDSEPYCESSLTCRRFLKSDPVGILGF